MTAFLITVLVVALFLRWLARQLVGRSARPQDVVHVDTGPNDRVLTSHRYKLTGQPDYILEEHGERFPMEHKSRDLDARGPYDGERLPLAGRCAPHCRDPCAPRDALNVRRNDTCAARCRGCGCGCGCRRQCSDSLA